MIFKERKTSKLKEIFKLEQTKMQESYELQMSKYLGKIQQIFQTLELVDSLEVHTNPPFVRLSLKHGHGLDQYVNLANFKEDYFVLFEVLGKNNQIASHYYLRQLNEFKKKGRKELLKLVSEKGKQIRLQEDKINQIMKQQLEKESRRKVLEKQVTSAWWEWNHLMEQLLMIKDILKEEFVKALSRWQDKMFSEEESPEERWIYHQYGQRMMKQAERIIGK
jgi:hypothetical protein